MDRPIEIVSIHQPTFFPWLGYFSKIRQADCFVFLDQVQNIKTGGSWVNRVKLLQGGQPKWFTCPLVRSHGAPQDVNQIEIDPSQDWRRKLLKTLEINYGRALHFNTVMPMLVELINQPGTLLASYNEQCIERIARELGLTCPLVRQAGLVDPVRDYKGSERLARICQQLGGRVYLAGGGADSYENVEVYQRVGIALRVSRFVQRPYLQVGQVNFVPGLSVLDALLNLGFERTAELLI
jgi:hypothetical protein